MAEQAVQRIAMICRIEREMSAEDRLALQRANAQPSWDELFVCLKLDRCRVAEGSDLGTKLGLSINHLGALTKVKNGELKVSRDRT